MGLGLAISRRFCQMMGGDIHSREQARPCLDLHDPAADRLALHYFDGRSGRRSTCTVAVMPATRRTPSGT
jgi:signal transduction histidine kinase